MSGLDQWLDPILKVTLPILLREHGSNLLSVVRFGSTTQFIKYQTDVDMLLIFGSLPHRRKRHDVARTWEDQTNEKLAQLKSCGFEMQVSPQLRTLHEAKHWSKIYLDMIDHHSIVYDPLGVFSGILAQVDQWVQAHDAHRVVVNGLPVWRYSTEATGVCFVEPRIKGSTGSTLKERAWGD